MRELVSGTLLCRTGDNNNRGNYISYRQHWSHFENRICLGGNGGDFWKYSSDWWRSRTFSIGTAVSDSKRCKPMPNSRHAIVPHWRAICVWANVENMGGNLLCWRTERVPTSSPNGDRTENSRSTLTLPASRTLTVSTVAYECRPQHVNHSVNWTGATVTEYYIWGTREKLNENKNGSSNNANLRCSSGTRSASMVSHCLARWLTHRAQARMRLSALSFPFRQGKCIACEFMCSALVDNHSICVVA